jgi:signal transduction histidine kinase
MPSERLHFRDIRRTSAFRLTFALGAVFAIGLIALLGLIYAMTVHELTDRSDRILRSEASRLLATTPERLPGLVASEASRNRFGLNYVALIAANGERVVGNIEIAGPIPFNRSFERVAPGGPVRMIAIRTGAGETILIGRDISQIRYLRRRILTIVALSGVTALLGIALAATLLSLGPLRRVRDLQTTAREISSGHFDARMPMAGRHDELDQFAGTVNLMVEEVGRVVAQVKGVTDAVAHDLRTPLTRVRAQLGRLLQLPGGESAAQAIADLDHVLARFAALLRIAEIETSARRSGFQPVRLGVLARAVHELYDPLAEDNAIDLVLGPCAEGVIDGDEKLLFEAFSNLVDNAIKFARSTVRISVVETPESFVIAVADNGPGIADHERDAVLRRFHRGTNAEGREGSGLGLSIVAAVAHLHGHELALAGDTNGLVARIVIPRAAA